MSTKNHTRNLLAVALLGAFAAPALACKAPVSPKSLPDGRKAEMQVMLDAKRSVEQYNDNVVVYFDCENNGLKLQEVQALQTVVLNRFNAEVRAFKAVNRDASMRTASLTRD